jgi:hypothetical protein
MGNASGSRLSFVDCHFDLRRGFPSCHFRT